MAALGDRRNILINNAGRGSTSVSASQRLTWAQADACIYANLNTIRLIAALLPR
jgi:hypothetical protein